WAITNVWMWSDELKDLLNDLKDGSINMLLVECLKRGLKNVDENSVLGFIARNPNVLDEPVQEYIELTRKTGEKLKLYPWINFKDYVEGSGIVFSKLEERKKKLLKAVESFKL
ncbi:MAG: hypothetical protein QXM98_06015, partial [Thermoproteota archaeon]